MFDKRMHPYELISKDGYGLDIVVVAPGYRLNVFGFLGADADRQLPGNWGFWDQRCAIEWISENVHFFGGNNQNVTLGGVSAGSPCCAIANGRRVFDPSSVILRTISSCRQKTKSALPKSLDELKCDAGKSL
jgi:hypothetical protein